MALILPTLTRRTGQRRAPRPGTAGAEPVNL